MDLPLSGVIGAAVGLGVGILDFAVIAALVRRTLGRMNATPDPKRMDLVMRGLFVVNALVFAGLGWWVGVSVSGLGAAGP
ncbi:hypothetical protein [Chthonobacter rhizosphaerae]|uniref:hypothetical protein n=1 Tax=Chthonobacter rhizosphaerae TaxID=2735553 RepID=UPI0015EF33ED|nr:hypothetical protein [Chthonobacter rhizosphaerae]